MQPYGASLMVDGGLEASMTIGSLVPNQGVTMVRVSIASRSGDQLPMVYLLVF